MEAPDSDATDPTVPGKDPPAGGAPDPEAAGAAVVGDDEAVELAPPQAARTVASDSPAATVVRRPRCRRVRTFMWVFSFGDRCERSVLVGGAYSLRRASIGAR
jgi:hypothetical protein